MPGGSALKGSAWIIVNAPPPLPKFHLCRHPPQLDVRHPTREAPHLKVTLQPRFAAI